MRPKANPTGNPRGPAKPTKGKEVAVVSAAPSPPEQFDATATELWDALWTIGVGVYNVAHVPAVTRYVEFDQRRRYFLDIIDSEGWTVPGSQGQPVINPVAAQLNKVEAEMRALEDRLGLSPEASIRLGLATVEVKSKLDAFLERSGN